MSYIKKKIRKFTNPRNLTHLHLKDYVEKHGFEVGDHSYGAPTIRWWGEKVSLHIGAYCSFADDVQVFLGGNHRTDWVTTYPFSGLPKLWPEAPAQNDMTATRGGVTIGSDVWFGSRSLILSNVTIGHGAVIGAQTVVTSDVAPYAIMVGNPAREVRKRFPEPVIAALLETAWWTLPRAAIIELVPLLQSNRMGEFIAACRARQLALAQ